MSNLSNEIVEKLINSKNDVLRRYGLSIFSMVKLISLFEHEEDISSSDEDIICRKLSEEANEEYVRRNCYRLMNIKSVKLFKKILEVSDISNLLDSVHIGYTLKEVELMDKLNDILRNNSDNDIVKEKAVNILIKLPCSINSIVYDYTRGEIVKKLLTTIVDVSSVESLLKTLDFDTIKNDFYRGLLLNKIRDKADESIKRKICEKYYNSEDVYVRSLVAYFATIDILDMMIKNESSNYVAEAIVIRLKELDSQSKEIVENN